MWLSVTLHFLCGQWTTEDFERIYAKLSSSDMLQAMTVLRAQFTDKANPINWIDRDHSLTAIGGAYGRFRFGTTYELPQNNKVMR